MGRLSLSILAAARMSLVALWCATAVISVVEMNGRSAALLGQTMLSANRHYAVILIGALLDAVVGLMLWRWHRPVVYKLAAANLLVMTVVATALLPSLWLDPLGSLAKNLPIAALLWILHRDAQQ